MVTGLKVDFSATHRATEHEQGVGAVVAVMPDDHARVVAGEEREIHRVDIEGDPLFPDVGLGAVGVSLASDLDVGGLGVVLAVAERRGESWDPRGAHAASIGRDGEARRLELR